MVKKSLHVVALLLLGACYSQTIAQAVSNSTLIALDSMNREIQGLYHQFPDSAVRYGKEFIKKSELRNDSAWLLSANSALAGAYFYKGDIDSTSLYLERAIAIGRITDPMGRTSGLLNNLALLYSSKQDYIKALNSAKEALSIAQDAKDSALIITSSTTLGSLIVATSNDYKKAYEVYRRAESFMKKDIRPQSINSIYAGIAGCAWMLDSLETARIYYEKAIQNNETNGLKRLEIENRVNLLNLKMNLGAIPVEDARFELLTLYNFIKEDNIESLKGDFSHACLNYVSLLGGRKPYLSDLFYTRTRIDVDSMMSLIEKNFNHFGVKILGLSYTSAADIYEGDGNPAKASYYLRKALALNDSVYKVQLARESALFNKEYDLLKTRYEESENKLNLSKLAQKNAEATAERNTLFLWASIATFLALLFIFQLRLLRTRSKQKEELLKREQKENELKLEKKNLELTHMAMNTKAQSEIFENFRIELKRNDIESNVINTIIKKVDSQSKSLAQMNGFLEKFRDLEPSLVRKLEQTFPDLNSNEFKLIAMIRAQLSNADMAQLLHIEERSVVQKKYRLKKKLKLQSSESIREYLRSLVDN